MKDVYQKNFYVDGPRRGFKFEQQSSRSVHPNRNDELRSNGGNESFRGVLGNRANLSKIHEKNKKLKKEAGSSEGGSPRRGRVSRRARRRRARQPLPLSKLQDVLLLLLRATFIKENGISWEDCSLNCPLRAATSP